MKKNNYIFIFLFFSIFNFFKLYAQDKVTFEKLELGKTDIQSIVYATTYDKYNNIWLATEEGALRCNSNHIYTYNTPNGIPDKIGNRVFCVFNDNFNNIWIGTEKGIAKFNFKTNKFESILFNGFELDKINQIGQSNSNELFFCSNKGLWKIKNNKIIPVIKNQFIQNFIIHENFIYYNNNGKIFKLNKQNLISSKIDFNNSNVSLIKKINNEIFIGTKNGKLYKADFNFNYVQEINFGKLQKDITIRDIEFKYNKYYIASDGQGVFILDINFKLLNQFKNNENDLSSISSNGVYDIYFGKDGIVWYSTYGGGLCFSVNGKDNFKILKHQINNKNSLVNNTTRAIIEDGNNIWFGTKKGISIYNKTTKNWNHILNFQNSENKENIVLCLEKQGDFIWAGTYNQGVYKINKFTFKSEQYSSKSVGKNKIYVDKVYSIFRDSKNNIWIGGIDGELTKINNDESVKKYSIKNIRVITEKSPNEIIVAGKEGVFQINNVDLIKSIDQLSPNSKKLNYNTINAIKYNNNNLILGTNGNGLVFYNFLTKKITVINKKNALPSSIIQGIILINSNDYWISTTKGISNIKFINNDTIIKNFNKTDGLSSNEFNYGSFYKDSNGLLYFGGIDGITYFNPKELKSRNVYPNIIFEEFKIDNKLIELGDTTLSNFINETSEINLSANQNSFGFKIIGVLHGYSSKVNYSYILEGFDSNWSPLTINNEINYTNLSPGNYTLRIKATNEIGDFGKERQIKIKIASPWYATFWAYILYIIIIGFGLITIVRITKIIEVKKSKEDQISFFNNLTHEIKTPLSILLNSINDQENTSTKSNEQIKSTIDRINNLVNQMLSFQRYSNYGEIDLIIKKIRIIEYIEKIIADFSPLLELKKLEVVIKNNFKSEIFYFDEEQLNKLLFNLISNAIKYSKNNGKIIINLDGINTNGLILSVQDFGIGIPKEDQSKILNKFYRAKNAAKNQISGTGLGLMIVKSIIDATDGKIGILSEENKGTTFTIELKSFEHLYKETNVLEEINQNNEINNEIKKFQTNKILIVEDNNELRTYLKEKLENYFLVYEASNGKEGLDLALTIYPDLILTDFMMPIMDGLEMSLKIKEDINLNHIPVFMLTALQDTNYKKEALDQGITEYIEKPINISILFSKITNTFIWQEKLKEKYIHLGVVDFAEKNKNQRENKFISKLEEIILEKIKDENFTLHDICQNLGMSRTSLYMKLKSLIDMSPQDFIILTKLKYAKKLLLNGEHNIKEVAYSCGFSNPKYFSTSFKKTFGLTPSEFIKSIEK